MKKIIVSIDIQQEYISEGRPFHIQSIAPSLANTKKIIAHARETNIPVWHVQHFRIEGEIFDKNNPLSDFISGFEPAKDEKLFIKNKYSCFSSPEFTKEIMEAQPDEIIILGYGSSMCCLCTIIDGIHRGYKFTLVEDATASRSFPHAGEEEMHRSAINILKQYAKLIKTDELISNELEIK